MKTINELRKTSFDFESKVDNVGSHIKYLMSKKIDFDVFLPTKNKNLQRGYVWDLEQKRELIWSILINRNIPHLSIISSYDKETDSETFLIIDGKQRLSSIIDFVNDKFTIEIENQEYLFSNLPEGYKLIIKNRYLRYYLIDEPYDKPITDDEKINWFKFINYSGTPQDKEHINSL
jgi:uncharacterized protein with ParB-like and HNH nuclease domain